MFDDVGDNVDFRVTLDETLPVFLDGRFVEIAEAAAESKEIFVGQRLITKQQDLMIEPGLVNDRKALRVDCANVEPIDARTKCGACLHNLRNTAIHRAELILWAFTD